ncbi:MAG: hypothetical protein NT023_20600 [Armatimonadetes bacterium]|nr:hypothetical protein [Armatimonadota bacterium]
MTITIELQPEQQERIATEARKRRLSVEEYLSRAIAGEFPIPPPKRTPAEAIDAWEQEGIVPIWNDRPEDSPELARKLRTGQFRREA